MVYQLDNNLATAMLRTIAFEVVLTTLEVCPKLNHKIPIGKSNDSL